MSVPMPVEHYENFPVASWLCPAPLRPAVTAIYWYARTADDLADEGTVEPAQRLADLGDYRQDLLAMNRGARWSPRWDAVFAPLAQAHQRHSLPMACLLDLLSAFEQDVHTPEYADRPALLDYCRRSANPVGRLMLHLYGVNDPLAHRRSDAICSALQLINFWQDLSIDLPRGRLYVPLADAQRHGLTPADLLAVRDRPPARALVAELAQWARELMLGGAPLARTLPGRFGWELRAVVQGGLRVLDKLARLDHASLTQRPKLTVIDVPPVLWRMLRM
ncbi:MAG: squalene synthase HpnC [Burkholderiales bacterium]